MNFSWTSLTTFSSRDSFTLIQVHKLVSLVMQDLDTTVIVQLHYETPVRYNIGGVDSMKKVHQKLHMQNTTEFTKLCYLFNYLIVRYLFMLCRRNVSKLAELIQTSQFISCRAVSAKTSSQRSFLRGDTGLRRVLMADH